jgi:hypothetical protein
MARDKAMGRSLDSGSIEKASSLKQSRPRISAEREAQMDFNGIAKDESMRSVSGSARHPWMLGPFPLV